ncbi:MAG: MFS transporter [Gammaproteobacteria bacterium]|nr:MFS transporter [Gammaproteobacteria bacterium]
MSTTIHIDELLDSNPIGRLQWRVVVLCFVLAVIDGFDAQIIAYVAPLIADQFALSPEVMGQLYSSALLGLMAGALIGSPVADRIGRKPVILVSAAVMGVFALLTATAESTFELFLYRFLTGLGLGGVMPTINILTAEFAPARRRALLMTTMFVGFPIGIMVGGVAAAALINVFGWESVFVTGGVLPLLMVPVVMAWLPESPRFLALKGDRGAALAQIVHRIAPEAGATPESRFETLAPEQASVGIRALFSEGRTRITLLLWVVFFANLLTMFAIGGWMPTVLNEAGYPLDRAILVSAMSAIGGVIGGLLIAVLIDRTGAARTLVAGFVAAGVAIALIGQVTDSVVLVLIVLFLSGLFGMGCQFGINALASISYDTGARTTGLGWALAIGRIGAIIGPVVVGTAIGMALPVSQLFLLGAIPMLVAAGAVFVLGRLRAS